MNIDVVTLGAHILDVHVWPVEAIAAGQSSQRVETIRLSAAGTACGTAVDLARIGLKVATVGCVGDDRVGRFLLQILHDEGVDCSNIVVRPDLTTSATVLPIRPNGERPALHALGANAGLTASAIDEAFVLSAPFLHLGGPDETPAYDLADLAQLAKQARHSGAVVTADLIRTAGPEYLHQLQVLLAEITYFMPNEAQILQLTGTTQLSAAVSGLRAAGFTGTAVVKLGAAGSVLAPPQGPWTYVPAYQLIPIDTTGCGDAYCAGFIAGLHRGHTPEESAVLGTRAAALVASGLGSDAGIVNADSLSDDSFPALDIEVISAHALDAMLIGRPR